MAVNGRTYRFATEKQMWASSALSNADSPELVLTLDTIYSGVRL
jgi:hypothetical protein